MSQVGAQIRAILAIDLFRLQPAGYTPLCAVGHTDQYEPKYQGVPKKGESGEVHLITDRSLVDLGEGEAAPLYKFYADQALKQHILGRRLDRLPFAVRHTRLASWLACLETFYENYKLMRVHLRAKEYDLDKYEFTEPLAKDESFGKRYDQVEKLWEAVIAFVMKNFRTCGVPDLQSYIEGMETSYRDLYRNVPPLRFAYLPDRDRAADALMYVMKAEQGANLFLGWQGDTNDKAGRSARVDMLAERNVTTRQFMNVAVARPGFAYAIPPMFPYGMTGGVEALIVEPAMKTYMVDDWGRSPVEDWWKKYVGVPSGTLYEDALKGGASKAQAEEVSRKEAVRLLKRLFEDCVVPQDALSIGKNQNGIYRQRIVGGAPLNAFLFNHFLARFITISKSADAFHLTAYSDIAMAWVVLGGVVSVTSPGGIELVLNEGDACLFPAFVSGAFKVEVHKSPVQYMAVAAPTMPGRGPTIR